MSSLIHVKKPPRQGHVDIAVVVIVVVVVIIRLSSLKRIKPYKRTNEIPFDSQNVLTTLTLINSCLAACASAYRSTYFPSNVLATTISPFPGVPKEFVTVVIRSLWIKFLEATMAHISDVRPRVILCRWFSSMELPALSWLANEMRLVCLGFSSSFNLHRARSWEKKRVKGKKIERRVRKTISLPACHLIRSVKREEKLREF